MNPWTSFKDWLWADPRGNLLLVVIVVGGILSLALFAVGTSAAVPTIIGAGVTFVAAQQVMPSRKDFFKQDAGMGIEELGIGDRQV